MQHDFPTTSETFTDCAGAQRHFEIEVRHLPNHGYAAEAREVSSAAHGGYIFKAFAEGSATLALARLRGKVRQGIAQRFLIREGRLLEMPFERMRGRIDSDGVVVDGKLLPWDEFIDLIKVSEGFEFDLHIPFESPW
jgi:mRNA degradation ribonuclease J1/J2